MNQCRSCPSNNHTVGCWKVGVNRFLTNNAKIQLPSYLLSDQMEIGCEGSINIQISLKDFWTLCWFSNFWSLAWKRDIRNTKFKVDNVAVNITQNTKLPTIHLDCEVLWLPQYSANLASVEWVFGVSKRIIRKFKSLRTIKFLVEFRQKRHNWKHVIIK